MFKILINLQKLSRLLIFFSDIISLKPKILVVIETVIDREHFIYTPYSMYNISNPFKQFIYTSCNGNHENIFKILWSHKSWLHYTSEKRNICRSVYFFGLFTWIHGVKALFI